MAENYAHFAPEMTSFFTPWEGRAMAEYAFFINSPTYYGVGIPRPEETGKAVLLIPGLAGSDYSLKPLAQTLKRVGYEPHFAGIDFNLPWEANIEKISQKAEKLTTNGNSVSIIGHSLGGIQGREVARNMSGKVDNIISLGSPIDPADPEQAAHPLVSFYARMLIHSDPHPNARLKRLLNDSASAIETTAAMPDSVNLISIVSTTDGIVHWQDCVDKSNNHAKNIIKYSPSHIGMPWNTLVVQDVGRELANSSKTQPNQLSKAA